MIRRMVLLSALACAVMGCKTSSEGAAEASVDEIAAKPLDGLTIKKLDTDEKTALDFLDPPGVENGVADAAHVITDQGVNYTLYEYDTEDSAKMAMELWRGGKLGQPPFSFQVTPQEMPALGPDGLFFMNGTATNLVKRVGKRILNATGTEGGPVGRAAGELTTRIGGVVPTAAP